MVAVSKQYEMAEVEQSGAGNTYSAHMHGGTLIQGDHRGKINASSGECDVSSRYVDRRLMLQVQFHNDVDVSALIDHLKGMQ